MAAKLLLRRFATFEPLSRALIERPESDQRNR